MSQPAPSSIAQPARASTGDRIAALVVAAGCLALLFIASRLHPDAAGVSTHTQLGLAPCGMLAASGYPCPTCGMTTAFAAAAGAQPVRALIAQPMGAALSLMTAVVFWGSLHIAVLGSQLGRIGVRILAPRVVWGAVAVGLLAWVYKIASVRGW